MSTRKRSKRPKVENKRETENTPVNHDFTHSVTWKIVFFMVIIAGSAVLLFQKDHETSSRKEIPNPETPLPASASILHTFKHAAVSSDSQVCSDIARDAMKEGSNIFDAAISALFCLSLTQIQSMGLLGGFLLTAYIKSEKKSIVIDAQLTSPKRFEMPKKLFAVKHGVATPGFLKGIWEMHKKYGSRSWKNLIQPSKKLCYDGFIMSKHLYDSLELNKRVVNDPYLRDIFVEKETKKFKRPGTKIILKEQCEFLELLETQDGFDGDIFSGIIGDLLSEDFKNASSIISKEDLTEYKVKWSEPVEYSLSDSDTLFIPKTAAIQIPSILNILKDLNIDLDSPNINDTILSCHRVVEVFKHVSALRSQLGDPDFVDVENVFEKMLSKNFSNHVQEKIDDKKTFNDFEYYSAKFFSPNDHGTSHLSIMSNEGDAISITSSINYYFGAGISGLHSGLVMNNGMDDFSYPEREINYFGLLETPTNYPQPGKRALSSMSPLIVVDNESGDVKLVIGAAGGSKIISSLSLALLRYLKSKNIKDIVDAPRFHHQLVPNQIEFEYGLIQSIVEGLASKGHKLKRFRSRGTIVNALTRNKQEINGIADFRKDWSGVAGY